MDIAYWIVAGLLALFCFYAGTLKMIRTRDQLRPMMAWADRIPLPALTALGTAEILGATGVALPPLTGIEPLSAPAAAIGFVLGEVDPPRSRLDLPGDRVDHLSVVPSPVAPPRYPVWE
ncbi:DoxX family protein [Streptomyces sp. NPDC018352]|uniref:DoxX family protein n=1 Tax=Streptomyces sp. NPDC018352 TaxID=3157194 RepID=UPI003406ECEC